MSPCRHKDDESRDEKHHESRKSRGSDSARTDKAGSKGVSKQRNESKDRDRDSRDRRKADRKRSRSRSRSLEVVR